MGMCPTCGAPTETEDRFCSACGDTLSGPAPGLHPYAQWAGDDSPDEPELIVLEPAPPPEQAVERLRSLGHRSTRGWLLVSAGLLAVAVAAVWGLGRTGDGADGTDEAARSPATTATTATTMLRAGTTATTDSIDTTVAAAEETVPTYDRDVGGPVLGHPVGWSLMVGQLFEPGLERIDLDSGQSTRFEGTSGAPVAVVDGRLLLQAAGLGDAADLRAVPLNDPTAQGTELAADSYITSPTWPVFPGRDGGLWVYASTAESTVWRLVRVSDGELIDEVPAPSLFQVSPLRGGGPDVVTSPAGGLYRRDGGGYRLLHPARPILINRGAALVVSCTLPDTCFVQWVDVERGEPVDRPLPPDDVGIEWAGTVDDAGRFLFGWRSERPPASSQLVLYDTRRERQIEVSAALTTGDVTATPDGRYLAIQTAEDIRIFDADDDRWVAVPRVGGGAGGANLLFVPNGSGSG